MPLRALPLVAVSVVFAALRCASTLNHAPSGATSGSSEPPSFGPRPPDHAARHRAAAARLASSPHVALGIPEDADPTDDVLLDEQAYVLSYNPRRAAPNWAAWQLDRSYLGNSGRTKNFRADARLPPELLHVEPEDYAHSGFERGHLCPSGDRTRSPEENALTFVMTNVVPQVHELNDGPWETLEEYERTLASEVDAALYIVAGSLFTDASPTIGRGVAVPVANYKIIVVLRTGQTANDVTNETSVLAVMMPNDRDAAAHVWTDFVRSIDEIEQASGYDFLSRVPFVVQDVIEAKVAAAQVDPKGRSHKGEPPRRTRE